MGVLKLTSKDEYEGDLKESFEYEGVAQEVPFLGKGEICERVRKIYVP
jgi:hypothetical protein